VTASPSVAIERLNNPAGIRCLLPIPFLDIRMEEGDWLSAKRNDLRGT
jgi:hypothetical protein